MALRNCDECRQVFDSFGGARRCRTCLEESERQWKLVRDYVKTNPGVPLQQVVKATEVPERRIREFITCGLLEPASMSGTGYACRRCSNLISSGDYCATCLSQLKHQVKGSLDKMAQDRVEREEAERRRKTAGGAFATQYRTKRG